MNPDVLKERYEALYQQSVDMWEHMPVFVDAVKEINATRVIELGVRYGHSTIAWMYALQGRGHLWSVDCSFPVPANPQGTPLERINLLDPQGPLGVVDYWTFILGYDTWPSVLDILPQKDVDIVFLDTNHVYEETLVELSLYYPRVRKGGRIYLHDTALETTGNAVTPQPPYPVKTAMEEFCAENGLKCENNPRCFGLGTIFC